MAWIKRFALSLAKAVGAYALMICGGTVLLLILSSLVGYLPYSDRPGPGWYGWLETAPDLATLGFFFSWTLLLLPYCLVAGILLFLAAWLLALLRAPRWLIALLGALASGYLSFYVVAGIGWYIAIAAFPVYGAGALGLLFGGLLLPRTVVKPPIPAVNRKWVWGAVSLLVLFGGILAYRTAVRKPMQPLQLLVYRVAPGTEPVQVAAATSDFDEEEARVINSLGFTGHLQSGIVSFHAAGPPYKRALVIIRDKITSPIDLPQADGVNVVYIVEGDGWKKIPGWARTLKRKIRLRPSQDRPTEVIVQVDQPGAVDREMVTSWYPPDDGATVLLTTGTLEPHGVINNGADNLAPVKIAAAVADEVNALIAPHVGYGVTGSMAPYPGATHIPADTYAPYVHAVLESLAGNGFQNIITWPATASRTSSSSTATAAPRPHCWPSWRVTSPSSAASTPWSSTGGPPARRPRKRSSATPAATRAKTKPPSSRPSTRRW
jgi:hypothetical protein